jgi:hypothetical protein
MYEQAQAAQAAGGASPEPDAGTESYSNAESDVVDADYKEV